MGKVMGVVKPKLAGTRRHGQGVGTGEGQADWLTRREYSSRAGLAIRLSFPMIPQEFIQSLLGRVDIVDVVDRHVKLKKAGANFQRAAAPSTTRRRPSFTVSPSKQFYHCFGCGAHGNAIGFLMEYSGLAYPEAIRALAETVGMPVPETRGTGPPRRRGGARRSRRG